MLLAILIAAAQFGERGQVVPFGSISFSRTTVGGSSANNLSLQPGALVFVVDHFALGLAGRYVYNGRQQIATPYNVFYGSSTQYGVEPMVGLALRFAETLSLFPQAGIDIFHDSAPLFGGDGTSVELETFAPLLFSPFPH